MPRIVMDDKDEFELTFDPRKGGKITLATNEVDTSLAHTFTTWVEQELFEWRNICGQIDGDIVVFTLPGGRGI